MKKKRRKKENTRKKEIKTKIIKNLKKKKINKLEGFQTFN